MKKNNKGFTLAELLIVVAIIGVLIAIAMPTFTGQLTKAKKNADLANLRAAYAEATVDALEEKTQTAHKVILTGVLTDTDASKELPFTVNGLGTSKKGTYDVTFNDTVTSATVGNAST